MTTQYLNDNYCFHDSTIVRIDYDNTKGMCDMDIVLCNCMQNGYTDSTPDLSLITLRFFGVKDFYAEEYGEDSKKKRITDFDKAPKNEDIMSTNYRRGQLSFLCQSFDEQYRTYRVTCEDVEVTVITPAYRWED